MTKEDTVGVLIDKIIADLNLVTGKNYRPKTESFRRTIRARLREGFKFEDFQAVNRKMSAEWGNSDMNMYLRPQTLYGTKFQGYLNYKPRAAFMPAPTKPDEPRPAFIPPDPATESAWNGVVARMKQRIKPDPAPVRDRLSKPAEGAGDV